MVNTKSVKPIPTIPETTKLRNYLQETLEDLPNNLPRYDEMRLLDDLTFLLRSPLFLYAISPRLIHPPSPSIYSPPTPMSMIDENQDNAFNISALEICIKWFNNSWAAQLSYGEKVLLEGRELDAEQERGFMQSFFWFCEEASLLAYEYKAREHTWEVRQGVAVDVDEYDGWRVPERSKGRDKKERRSLKLRIRLRSTERGRAGVWRVE